MKKVFIAAVLFAAFGFNATYADTTVASDNQVEEMAQDDQFKVIEVDSLPQAVKDAAAKNYEGQTIKAAYVKDVEGVKTYKVTLANAEGSKTSDILFNEKGEVFPVKDAEAK